MILVSSNVVRSNYIWICPCCSMSLHLLAAAQRDYVWRFFDLFLTLHMSPASLHPCARYPCANVVCDERTKFFVFSSSSSSSNENLLSRSEFASEFICAYSAGVPPALHTHKIGVWVPVGDIFILLSIRRTDFEASFCFKIRRKLFIFFN